MCFYANLYREMGLLLLGEDFAKYSPNDDGIVAFKRAMGIVVDLMQGRDPEHYLFKALSDLLTSPWTDPILNEIINGDELETTVGS